MNVTCELDGYTVGGLARNATTTQWTYHAPVCSKMGLQNMEHTFVIRPQAGISNSYMVFDYLEYECVIIL